MSVARSFILNSGQRMPAIGFGTYLLKGDALKEALDCALCLGYRHVDTAISYDNDADIGDVIQSRVKAGHLKRSNLFVTTKVQNLYAHEKDITNKVHGTLANLRLKNVDMLLIHHPWEVHFVDNSKKNTPEAQFQMAPYVDFCKTWQTLESLHSSQHATNIGLSNFTAKQIERIFKISKVPPSNVQLEAHVYYQQKKIKEFCHSQNIVVSAYAPLGAPNRPSRHKRGDESILTDPAIVEIAKSYKKTPAQILLNFLVQSGFAVLPKSGSKERMEENLGSLDWSLSKGDVQRIQELDRGIRFFKFYYMRGHPEFFEDEEF